MLEPTLPSGPSLVALRAFEAAARAGSFTRAAEELQVSPAAIAQHVKSLEAWSGQALFERGPRGVRLNEAGARARPALTDAFQRLAAAATELRVDNPQRWTVHLAALPAIAELWLTPRLASIRAALPGLDLAVHALDRKPDLQHGGFDATAYFEPTQTHSDQLVLVAAPSVAARLARMDDLDAVPRLIDRAWEGHWHQWVGPEHAVTAGPVIEFTLFAMATSAVCAGHGVLVGRLSLLGALLATGELVEPFDRRVATGDHIAFRRRDDRRLEPLDDWLETCFDHSGQPPPPAHLTPLD